MRDREDQPRFVSPMLLSAGAVPDGDGWVLELKWDGCRAQLRYDGRAVSLRTRHGREASAEFPELAEIADVLQARRVTLDGELVCLRPDGHPDFHRLRGRLAGAAADRRHPVMLQVFDLLHLDGRSTRGLPYRERRALLGELALDGPAWRTPASVAADDAQSFLARVAELGLEGVVAKRLNATYLAGRRTKAWVKHKLRREEHLAVTGLRRTREGRVDAIRVARRLADGSFAAAGTIELGLAPDLLAVLEQRLVELPPRRRGAVTWYPAEVSVIASVHGLPDGPIRDGVLREIVAG
jgi:bifunctional non-homologous end joining protein LigD